MLKQSELREAVLNWIKMLPVGTRFRYLDTYEYLEQHFPAEIAERGDEVREPKYRHDARFGVWDAKRIGLVKLTGVRGERQRC